MGTPPGELDTARLRAIAASDRPLAPHECADRARRAAALIEPGRLDRAGPGEAVLLWRDEHSAAWLNLWWQPRDTGYHDHAGSCAGVHMIGGRAWNEPLTSAHRRRRWSTARARRSCSPARASTAWITRPEPSPSTSTRRRS